MRTPSLNKPWYWTKAEESTLAKFVAPDCVRHAIEPMGRVDGSSVHDVKDKTNANTPAIARAMFEHLATLDIDYDKAGYSPHGDRQRIRPPHEMVKQHRGTCLDLALLFAGLALDHQVRPLIIVLEDHALVGIVATDLEMEILGAMEHVESLRGWIRPFGDEGDSDGGLAMSAVVPIECVGFAKGTEGEMSFEEAVSAGRRAIESKSLRFFFDPQERHNKGIDPEPCAQRSGWRIAGALSALAAAIAGIVMWIAMLTQPGPPRMPDVLDGRNIAVFPLQTSGELSGTALADELATQLRATFADAEVLASATSSGWNIWGPEELSPVGSYGADADGVSAILRERNAAIGIYGTAEQRPSGRVALELQIWFSGEDGVLREAGLEGPFVFWAHPGVQATQAEIIRRALNPDEGADIGSGQAWLEFFLGLQTLHDSRTGQNLGRALVHFDAAGDGAVSERSELHGIANLLEGGMHLLLDPFLEAGEAKEANVERASDAFAQVTAENADTNTPLADRARLGQAQLELALGCRRDAVDEAAMDRAWRVAEEIAVRVPFTQIDDPAEVALRARQLLARIEYCRVLAGTGDRAVVAGYATEVIDEFEQRTERDRVGRASFLVSPAYHVRGMVADGPDARRDLEAAYCRSPERDQDFYLSELTGRFPIDAEESLCLE